MDISLETIATVEKTRVRGSNTLKVTTNDGREVFVPKDMGNKDYRIVNEWIKSGGKVLPPPPKAMKFTRPKTAHIEHPLFLLPDDHELIVWRYMSFEHLISLISNKALWFSRGYILTKIDPYEGQLPEKNLQIKPEELFTKIYGVTAQSLGVSKEYMDSKFVDSHRWFQETASVNMLINCWNMFEHESNAMWRVYGKGNNCVAVKSNIKSLKNAFGEYKDYYVMIGEVKYIDYKIKEIDEKNQFSPFLHKAPFYESEHEIRCIIYDDGDISLFPETEPYHCRINAIGDLSPGAFVQVDLPGLIKEIVLGPDSDPWFQKVVSETMLMYGLGDIPIKNSVIKK